MIQKHLAQLVFGPNCMLHETIFVFGLIYLSPASLLSALQCSVAIHLRAKPWTRVNQWPPTTSESWIRVSCLCTSCCATSLISCSANHWLTLTFQMTILSICQAQIDSTFLNAMLKYSFWPPGSCSGTRHCPWCFVICTTKTVAQPESCLTAVQSFCLAHQMPDLNCHVQ